MKDLLNKSNREKNLFKSYYCAEQAEAKEYSNYQQVYQQKVLEREARNKQYRLLKNYQGCKKCGSLAVDAYDLHENNRLVCQPCRMKKEGGSSSPISFAEQQKRQQLESLKAQLEQKKQEAQQNYQAQKNYLELTATLAKSPQIQAFFTDLLTTYAQRFANSQNLDISHTPLVFEGLYWDKKTGHGFGEMGRCFRQTLFYPRHEKNIAIGLNRLYLLNKFDNNRYFPNYPQGDFSYLDISFVSMIKTCSHEIAHYIQLIKHGKSSCESDLKLNNGKYNAELAKEHKEFTGEIYGMVKNSGEYSE
ncbi:8370_t:CDS:2 [Ambispora gerdemannii]|uniref:8370_t:CDS:1 n=1 Tax=Ambispora gerdemannii TaxID=144530 RepID=A0A9N9G3N6_9GLOM|nr:8370_t:CDS:2 [Ambispora gerdemannii]